MSYSGGYGGGYGPVQYGRGPAAAPLRRRSRWPVVLLVVVLVLAGLFVAADRIAASLAESKAADALQSSQHLATKPDVTVDGFPFLTQLIARRFGEIDVEAKDVSVGSSPALTIGVVDAHLHTVTVSGDYSTFHVARADAVAHIGFAELGRALGTPVHYGGDGRLVAEPSVTVLGQRISATISARVAASTAQGMTFTDPKISAGGVSLPGAASKVVAAVFEQVISLNGLPFGAQVTSTEVTSSGVALNLAADDLTYTRG